MPDVRAQIRQAAIEFADHICEIVQAASVVVPAATTSTALTSSPASEVDVPDSQESPLSMGARLDNMLTWIARHPGATAFEIRTALKLTQVSALVALENATKKGTVIRDGYPPFAHYTLSKMGELVSARRRSARRGSVRERVRAFVEECGSARPKDITVGASRTAVRRALTELCEAGELIKRGTHPAVEYLAVSARRSKKRRAGPSTKANPSNAPLVDAVVAFVRAQPGCRFGTLEQSVSATKLQVREALSTARQHDLIRMEGTRSAAHYFVVDKRTS